MKGHHRREFSIEDSSPEEPPEDFYGFEIITDEEIANLTSPFLRSSSSSNVSMSSQSSSSSLGSTGTGPTVIRSRAHQYYRHDSSSSLSSTSSSDSSSSGTSLVLTDDELTASVKIWYSIQLKGHGHKGNDHETMEHDSISKKTGWLFNLLHFPEKLKQNAADRNRFNLNGIPEETRQQLKRLYVY